MSRLNNLQPRSFYRTKPYLYKVKVLWWCIKTAERELQLLTSREPS